MCSASLLQGAHLPQGLCLGAAVLCCLHALAVCVQALDFVAGLGLLQPPMQGALIPPPPPAAPPPPTSHHIMQEVRAECMAVACQLHGQL